GVSVPALTKDHKGIKLNMPYPEKTNTPYWKYGMNIIFWKISSVVPTLRNPQYAVSNSLGRSGRGSSRDSTYDRGRGQY
ncbi:hypothetical protein Tco_0579827, partial [Tanacetum coccineum]